MAVTAAAAGVERPVRRVTAWHFVRLKLRVTANGLRGHGWRVALFVLGVLFALGAAVTGYLVLALPGLLGEVRAAGAVAALGGAALVLGWLFLPLVFFGVDESLDPARFALLPLGRHTLVSGLFAASLAGIPAIATLVATFGIVHGAAALAGPLAGVTALVGVICGLLLCVSLCRAVTSAFSTALRSRRARDLAAVLLAVLAALISPLQLLVMAGARNADWDRVVAVGRIVGWTPLGAPYSLGQEVVEGRLWAVPVKLLITLVTLGVLALWWSRSLETAMLGATGSARGRDTTAPLGSPVDRLFPRMLPWLPRNRFGALVAREVHYWWRETRRRANLITFTVVGIFLPVMLTVSGDITAASGSGRALLGAGSSLIFVGALAALSLANQFGFEGNAYAANVIAGVPGRTELHARVLGYSIYLVPLLTVVAVVVGVVVDRPAGVPALLGMLIAAYGTGLALVLPVSVRAAYALPDTANPFAISSGAGMAKGFLSFAALIAASVATLPLVVAAFLLGDAWVWLGLPLGIAYGTAAYLVGVRVAAVILDRRMPELLATVTPNR